MDKQNQAENQAGVVDAPKKRSKTALSQKWGAKVIDHGYCSIPSLLLWAQRRLHLNPTQLAVLLQIIDFWWEAGRKPFPSKSELSKRLGIGERQIQRYLTELEVEGLLRRVPRYSEAGHRLSNIYDLQGLVDKLAAIEPDYKEVRETARRKKQEAGVPGYRPKKKRAPEPVAPD